MAADAPGLKRSALIVSTLASFTTPFMGSSVNIALPDIERTFALNAVALGWVASSYLLAAAMFLLPFGRLADIHGRKRVFTIGLAVHSAASLLAALAPSGASFLAARAVQGVGGGMIFGTGMAILVSVYPPAERGRVLGINVAAVYTGLSLGPFVGGFLTHALGWRSLFIVVAALGLGVMAVTAFALKGEWAGARGERFDTRGAVAYSLSLTAVMLGFSLLPGIAGAVLLAAGVLGLAGFALLEARTEHPLLDVGLFRYNRVFAFSSLAALINYSATSAVTFLMSLYLQYIKGLPPTAAGTVLIAQPVTMALFSPLAGRLSDRVEPRIVASVGMAIIVVGLGLLVALGPDTSIPRIVVDLLLLGLGFALFSSPNTNAVMSAVQPRMYSVASAALGTMRLTGQMLSMGIVILIFATHIGKVRLTPEAYPAFLSGAHTAFVTFAVLSTAGVFFSLVRGRARPAPEASPGTSG
ncbi:MAG: MFS transporter [Gemmatimonadota bacterium]